MHNSILPPGVGVRDEDGVRHAGHKVPDVPDVVFAVVVVLPAKSLTVEVRLWRWQVATRHYESNLCLFKSKQTSDKKNTPVFARSGKKWGVPGNIELIGKQEDWRKKSVCYLSRPEK